MFTKKNFQFFRIKGNKKIIKKEPKEIRKFHLSVNIVATKFYYKHLKLKLVQTHDHDYHFTVKN